MVLASFRERTDDTRRAEDALLFIHDQKSATRMQGQIDGLVSLTDSLDRYRLDLSASAIRTSLDALRSAAREEYEQASAGRGTVAEMISQQRTRPAIAAVDSSLGVSATMLRNRTRQRVADATSETLNAERFVAGALVIALLIALVIALWLLRSISRPVHELERGMHAIAEGDLSLQLRLPKNEETEFGRLAASYQTMARQLAELERLLAALQARCEKMLAMQIQVLAGTESTQKSIMANAEQKPKHENKQESLRLSDQEKGWVQAAADEVAKREPALALRLEADSADRLKKLGVKVVDGVDKSGFESAAKPIQDSLAKELGPHAVKILELVRNVK